MFPRGVCVLWQEKKIKKRVFSETGRTTTRGLWQRDFVDTALRQFHSITHSKTITLFFVTNLQLAQVHSDFANTVTRACPVLLLLLLFIVTFVQDICSYMPKTIDVSRQYVVAAVL
jgi:hypothetical protein